jgi:hypothetical protein
VVIAIGAWGFVVSAGPGPRQAAKTRSLALQESLLSRSFDLVDGRGNTISTAKSLLAEVRRALVEVTVLEGDNARLENSMDEVWSLLKLLAPEKALKESTQQKLSNIPVRGERYVLLGGGAPKSTNFQRDGEVPHFRRVDGARFEFRLIVEELERDEPLAVLSYGFGITLPGKTPGWARFDLNLPGHDNVDDGLRAHLHPGTEDWSVPSPLLSPHEALDLMIWYAGELGERKPRS